MWSYYGRKFQYIKKYPKPIYSTIVEPFAGTASYALSYFDRDVIISDIYPVVYRVWKYLQLASPRDILSLPDVENGENISKYSTLLSQEEYWLMGFCINGGSNRPKHTASSVGNFNYWNRDKIRIAENLYKIRHWRILNDSYLDIKNQTATWYIDAPYQFQKLYVCNTIDYWALRDWCKFRQGQVIVCEQMGADWLPFVPLTELSGQRKKSIEAMWYRE